MTSLIVGLLVANVASASDPANHCKLANEGGAHGDIVERVCRGLAHRDDYRRNIGLELEAREKVYAAPIGSEERYLRLLDWEAANALLEKTRDSMNTAMNGALGDTLRLYNIAPTRGSGSITDGPGIHMRANWNPAYAHRMNPDDPIFRKVDMPDGRTVYVRWNQGRRREEQSSGVTWFDGRVDIMDGVLERVYTNRSPRLLAYLLHHESVHFDQLRNGNWSTLNEREVAAYKVSIADAKRFGLTKLEIKELEGLLAHNQLRLQRQRAGSQPVPPDFPGADDQEANRLDWEKLVAAESKRIALTLNLAEERRLREGMRNSPSAEPEEIGPFGHLEANSRFFCESPQYVSDGLPVVIVWADALMRIPRNLAVLDLDLRIGTMSCADYVTYQAIFHSRNGVDVRNAAAIRGLIEEGLTRQTEPNPRRSRARMSIPSSPQTPAPDTPHSVPTPEPVFDDSPSIPAIPRCRYHDWCLEPGKK